MNSFDQIAEIVSKGNKMGLSNTIVRDYGIPLDYTSVYKTFNDAVIYAAENSRAYVGQLISVAWDDGTSEAYIICAASQGETVINSKHYDVYIKKLTGDGSNEGDSSQVITEAEWQSHLSEFSEVKDDLLETRSNIEDIRNDLNVLEENTSSVNINKLTQGTDDTLVLDCGSI